MMTTRTRMLAFASLLASLCVSPALAQFTLYDIETIGGDATDLSGLTGTDVSGVPKNLLGAFGSGMDYDPITKTYISVSDRGPFDGASDFHCRVQIFRVAANDRAQDKLKFKLIKTVMLTAKDGTPLVGSLSKPEPAVPAPDGSENKIPQRLDPESIRVAEGGPAGKGTWWISDEYGPWIDQFSSEGKHLRRLELPARYAIAKPAGTYIEEMPPNNTSGRQANRGFESLAISPSGRKIYTVTQSPLLQDNAVGERNRRNGVNMRLLEISLPESWETDPASAEKPTFKEYLYQLDDARDGVNEIICFSETDLLVLERDGKGGLEANRRGLFRVSVAADSPLNKNQQPSDISAIESLPRREVPEGVVPLNKLAMLDFMDKKWGLINDQMPEKLEGIVLGPEENGERLLFITSDNDLQPQQPTRIWAFKWNMGKSALPPVQPAEPEVVPEPTPVEQPAPKPAEAPADAPAPDPLIHPAPSDMPKH